MIRKSVLLTRSYKENIELADALRPKGYDCINCAMLEYHTLSFDYSLLNDCTNIVITSKYAANLLRSSLSGHQVFVVGDVSAKILELKGYKIGYIAKNARELKQHLEFINIKGVYLASNHKKI
jgi:uroporphyrinogen-III synthase